MCLIFSTILFTACPAPALDPGSCYSEFFIKDKGSLTPLKDSFIVGETIVMEINIPAEIENINDEKFNLYEIFNEEMVRVEGFGISLGNELFEGNKPNVLKGKLTEEFFVELQFNENTQSYEFLCEIELLKEGEYRFNSLLNPFSIRLGNNEDNCSENFSIASNFINPEDESLPPVGFFTVTTQ